MRGVTKKIVKVEQEIKVFPNCEESEKAVLGSILLKPELLPIIKEYIPNTNVFYYTKHQIIWETMLLLKKAEEPIDTLSISSKLSNKDKENVTLYYITGLPEEVPSTANVEYHAKVVLERYLKRELIKSSMKIQNGAYEDTQAFDRLIKKVKDTTETLSSLKPNNDPSIEDIIGMTFESIQTKGNYINFGFSSLDNLAGGMTKGEITVIAGRPGHGKTTFSVNLVRNFINQGHKVLMINREMTNVEMMKKLVVLESGNLSYTDVRNSNLDKQSFAELETVFKSMKLYRDNLIMLDTIRDLDSVAAYITKHKPDVVIDDYIQLIKMEGYDQRRFELETVMNEYKWLAKKHQIVPVLVSQLNRDIEKRIDPIPKMSDLAESGSIEQVAENVLFVFYDYKVNYNNSELGKEQTQIIAAKVRYGENKKLTFGFDGNKVAFFDLIENPDKSKFLPKSTKKELTMDAKEIEGFLKQIDNFGDK